ncbi:MAG: PTS sugar transporter subunit IIA [Paracoccaceae bacterium]
MIGIVIVAHGGLAREYLAAMQHVVGVQSHVRYVAIDAECDRTAKAAEIADAADAVDDGDGVVVVADMHGGSPANLALPACRAKNRKIMFGANLPLLVKLAKCRKKPIEDAVRSAQDAGRKYIGFMDGGG